MATITAVSAISNARVEPPFGTLTPSIPLQVKSAQLSYDRTWSPYIQGTLVCKALDAAGATATDPRLGRVVRLTWTHTYNGVTTSIPLTAWLRTRVNDRFSDTATLTFASVESIMQDYAEPDAFVNQTTDLDYQLVSHVLTDMRWTTSSSYPSTLLNVEFTDPSAADANIPPANGGWNAGSTAWSIIQSVGEVAGLWYRGTESGLSLARCKPGYSADTSTHLITGTDRVISATDTVSRDSADWANQVVLSWPTTADYGTSGSTTGPWKSYIENRTGKARTGGAAPMAVRMSKRGRTVDVRAITDLACRPNMTYRVKYRGDDWTGTVQAVAFSHPEGVMNMKLNVTEA